MTISTEDSRADLRRLRLAIEAVSSDLDAIEGRSHLPLRLAAERLELSEAKGLEAFVHHFAFAIKRNTLTRP